MPKIWIVVFSALLLVACAQPPAAPPVAPPAPAAESEPEAQVGTKQLEDEPTVWKEYQCNHKTLPFLVIERNELSTSTLHPGEEFRHRFVYSLCPAEVSKPLKVELGRTISRLGDILVRDTDKRYELKPGKWAVNALIKVPRNAPTGAYALRLNLTDPQVSVEGVIPFVVQKKR